MLFFTVILKDLQFNYISASTTLSMAKTGNLKIWKFDVAEVPMKREWKSTLKINFFYFSKRIYCSSVPEKNVNWQMFLSAFVVYFWPNTFNWKKPCQYYSVRSFVLLVIELHQFSGPFCHAWCQTNNYRRWDRTDHPGMEHFHQG